MSTIYETHSTDADNLLPTPEKSMLAEAQQCSEECVREHPISSVVVAVGVGVAVGIAAVVAFSSGEDRRRKGMLSQLSQQMGNKLGHYLPNSLYDNR